MCLPPASKGTTYRETQLTTNTMDESGILIEGDHLGRVHIAYARAGEVFYQCHLHEGLCVVPEERVCFGGSVSLAVDAVGVPHVVSVSTGQVFYASRAYGAWTSSVAGVADSASLAIMENGQVYVAYSRASYDGDARSELVLARISTGALSTVSVLLNGYDTTYSCDSRPAGEHHDYIDPVLGCSSGVVHVAARHLRNRDESYEPGEGFCAAAHDERVAYCRYDTNSTQSSFSSWSFYHSVAVRAAGLCVSGDGVAHLAFADGSAAYYSESLLPWSAESLLALYPPYGVYPAAAVDSARSAVTGILADYGNGGGTHLRVREGGAFGQGYLVKATNMGWDVDLCMEYLAIATIQESGPGTNEVFLITRLDGDEDGIGDEWELRHFDGLTNASPAADADEDGTPNGDEYIGRTDPQDSNSVFRMDRIGAGLGLDQIQLSWSGAIARFYTLQTATNVTDSWISMTGCTDKAGQGAIITFTNPAPALWPACYRTSVRIAP